MRRWWPFLFIALLCLPAVSPYLGGDIPRSNDSLSHLYRAFQLARLVRAGIFFPRWAPDLAHGYGYPIFNYFAYLSHYLIVLFHLLGLPLLSALRASYVVALIASGFTAHIFARDLAGGDDRAGLVAAVAYVYSPYVLYTAHVRGGLPENLALAFLPLALWAARRALRIHHEGGKELYAGPEIPRFARNDVAGTPLKLGGFRNFSIQLRDFVSSWFNSPTAIYVFVAALAIAAFITAHAGMALQYLPLIGLFGLYIIFSHTPTHPHRLGFWLLGFGVLSLIFTLALALTAFLWLPTLTDLAYVQYQIAFARSGATYTNNFFYITELFAYPRLPVYTDALNPPLVRSLPLLASALAILGLFRKTLRVSRKADYLFLFALFILTSFLITDLSKPVWDNSSLLQRSVLPWRFLGPASLFASVLAGLAIGDWRLEIRDWKLEVGSWKLGFGILEFGVLALLVAAALPFLFPPREPAPEQPTLADLARYEAPPFLVGTTTNGEYTPNPVKEFPDTTDQRAALLANREPERLDIAASPPPGVAVEHLAARPAHDTYRLSLAGPLTATYRSFFFPGWQATLDGKPLDIRPTDPHGLIAFDLPAGEHTLEIRFGSTPIRTGANVVSVIGLLVISYCVLRIAYRSRKATSELQQTPEHGPRFTFDVFRAAFAAVLIAALFIVPRLITRSGPPATQHPLNLDFGGELTLVGYDQLPITNYQSTLTLIWQAQHPLGVPYGMNVRLTDDAGLIWSDTNIERPRDWRFVPGTDFWPAEEFIYDSYVLKPLPGAPPGVYHLEAIVYRADTLQALSVQRLGEYVIERPTNLPLAEPVANLDGVALIHVSADRDVAAPGDPYRLTLRWQAASASPAVQDFKLELIDSAGAVAHALAGPVTPGYPPSKWETGDVLDQPVFFRLPAYLNSGGYHWRLNGAVELAASLQINAPDRVFAPPALANPVGVDLGESISLLGYNIAASGNEIKVDLIWQARAEMSESYRVFLHLLDANGNLVSQSDGEPANWTRPTTGWLAGEVVIDSRTLAAPGPGEYTLRVGMVNEAGERLAVEGWADGAIILTP
jgi:hypothetical protein